MAVAASARPAPRVVFLPTGAQDSADYAAQATASLKAAGAGEVEPLFLTRNPSRRTVEEAFRRADLVYLGGGGAPAIVKHGNRYDLADRLRGVLDRGGVVAGLSGGAIALAAGGCGAYNGYRPLPGWGLVGEFLLPHYHPGEEAKLGSWFDAHPGATLWGQPDGTTLAWDGQMWTTSGGPAWRLGRGTIEAWNSSSAR